MKDEIKENILIMGAFTLCPNSGQTMLANECLECEYININNEVYTCLYDESGDDDTIRLVDLITLLLELVESGKTHISKKELIGLLDD